MSIKNLLLDFKFRANKKSQIYQYHNHYDYISD